MPPVKAAACCALIVLTLSAQPLLAQDRSAPPTTLPPAATTLPNATDTPQGQSGTTKTPTKQQRAHRTGKGSRKPRDTSTGGQPSAGSNN